MKVRGKELNLSSTAIMGIINVTPDSFSDGGKAFNVGAALTMALSMKDDGASIIDIGGESTRPGSVRIGVMDEIERVVPVIKAVRQALPDIIISVDTYKYEVALKALEAGADIINDIYAGTFNPEIFDLAAQTGAGLVLMHMKGTPETMQNNPEYSEKGVLNDVIEFLKERAYVAQKKGVSGESIIIDPGIGFGKNLKHNLELLEGIGKLKELGYPVLIGTSRKSMIGKILNNEVPERLMGTAATVAISIARGADIVRVHDVREIRDVVKVSDAMSKKGEFN